MNIKRPKLSEFHHGRSLFYVWVTLNKDRNAFSAKLGTGICQGRPWDAHLYKNTVSLFVDTLDYFPGGCTTFTSVKRTYKNKHSLFTGNVVWNGGYNLHHFFTKHKHAQRYIDRINSGCLSAAERRHLAESIWLSRYY